MSNALLFLDFRMVFNFVPLFPLTCVYSNSSLFIKFIIINLQFIGKAESAHKLHFEKLNKHFLGQS